MAHVTVPAGLPGIVGLLSAYPATARPLNELAEALLRPETGLGRGERELIAAYVSSLNACRFCTRSHAAAARHLLASRSSVVDHVLANGPKACADGRLRALLEIAAAVQRGGRGVTPELIGRARDQGASERDVHDTVLIAAAFCMYNRYVDGLAAWTPDDPALYDEIGRRLATDGYRHATLEPGDSAEPTEVFAASTGGRW